MSDTTSSTLHDHTEASALSIWRTDSHSGENATFERLEAVWQFRTSELAPPNLLHTKGGCPTG